MGPVSPPAVRQAAEPPSVHNGHVYQPLSASPVGTSQWRTVDDVLDWAIPTRVEDPEAHNGKEHRQQDLGPVHHFGDELPDRPEDDGLGRSERPLPRRSARGNKGKTSKYRDYVSEEELFQHLPKD